MDQILEFTGNNTLLVLALLISFFVVVFTEMRRKAGELSNVGPGEAVKLINNNAIVIDLRSVEMFSGGHIANAKNIPSDELNGRMDGLAQDKSKPVLAVCNAGITSAKAAKTLRTAGFENVYSLKGGMTAWAQAGFPVVTGKKTKAKKSKNKT
ncbi:MAG: rhodanese-like domain-containing protein [Proteobacteria bacterium]|nr:rhodanese-like domain-containing protein [Pseudomonadota bacterium]